MVGHKAFSLFSLVQLGSKAFFQRFLLSVGLGMVLGFLQLAPWLTGAIIAKPLTGQLSAIGFDQQMTWVGPAFVGGLVFACLVPVEMFLTAAYVNSVANWVSNGRRDVASLAESGGPAIRYIMAKVLTTVISGAIALVLCLPVFAIWLWEMNTPIQLGPRYWSVLIPLFIAGLWVHAGLMQAPYAAALDDLDPVDAIRRSWSLAGGPRVGLMLWWLTMHMTLATGLCCTCGVFSVGSMALPLYSAGLTAAWIRASRDLGATNEMRFFRG